jgi:2-polyprenyl-3-methyl-5-hydroxy-6-metoxy-1,4-benzoquinol methylase
VIDDVRALESVPCDLCGAEEAESAPLYTLRDTFHDLPGEFVLRRCRACGLMYLSPRPTPQGMLVYYPDAYSNYRPAIEDEWSPLMRWMRQRKLAARRTVIERASGLRRGRLLDVGCSTGLFLHEMDLAGWEIAGVEPVAGAAAYARERFGLEVVQGPLHEATYAPASFDAITFWDVLEHTFSPRQALGQAAALLRPGGYLFASVPNWDSFNRRLFGRYWQGLDTPRHLYVFPRETLAALLRRAGFEVVAWRCFMPGYFSTVMSVTRWLKARHPRAVGGFTRIANVPGMRFPFATWFALSNWLDKAPIITVIARKPALDRSAKERA